MLTTCWHDLKPGRNERVLADSPKLQNQKPAVFCLEKVVLKTRKLLEQLDQSIQKDDFPFSQLHEMTIDICSCEPLGKSWTAV